MDNEEQMMDRVKRILVKEFELDEKDLKPTALIYDELGFDSLDSVDLVVALEQEFKFKVVRNVDETKIKAIRQLKDVYSFILEKQGELKTAK
jgi:acyl carrier protein